METDLIIVNKDQDRVIDTSLKDEFVDMLHSLFNIDDNSIVLAIGDTKVKASYMISDKSDGELFVNIKCDAFEMLAARALSDIEKGIKCGEHRKNYFIIISYDESSQLFCSKLMPLFGTFERTLRQIVYITLVKAFGRDWFDNTFTDEDKGKIKGKVKNNTKTIEEALDELTYSEVISYLFDVHGWTDIHYVIDHDLSSEQMSNMSKEEIVKLIEQCREESLWHRFFSTYKDVADLEDKINILREDRNTVMHHKYITYEKFIETRRLVKIVNKGLKTTIMKINEELYTSSNISAKDVLAALASLAEVYGKYKKGIAALLLAATEAISKSIDWNSIGKAMTPALEASQKLVNASKAYNYKAANIALPKKLATSNYIHNLSGVASVNGKLAASLSMPKSSALMHLPKIPIKDDGTYELLKSYNNAMNTIGKISSIHIIDPDKDDNDDGSED